MTKAYKRIQILVAAMLLGGIAIYWTFFSGVLRFSEQVQLSDGRVIEVRRVIHTKSFGEIGGGGGWEATYSSLAIPHAPDAKDLPEWESKIGLVPMLIDRDAPSGKWFLVATFFSCDTWRTLGKPPLPYAEFSSGGGKWKSVPLSQEFIGRKGNVMLGIRASGEPKLLTLPDKAIRDFESNPAPMYRKILKEWSTSC